MFRDGGDASRIVFVADSCGVVSMAMLKEQLARAIASLVPTQSFDVVFFKKNGCESLAEFAHKQGLIPATMDAKRQAFGRNGFLDRITQTFDNGDPIPAIQVAFKCDPQLIYLVAGGDFSDNDAVLKKVRELMKDHPKVKVNTIAFTGDGDNDIAYLDLLKKIASESGGVFRRVKESELEGE